MYRHLLFNRLGRNDNQFDVGIQSRSNRGPLTDKTDAIAIHNPPGGSPTSLRCLSHLGTHRERPIPRHDVPFTRSHHCPIPVLSQLERSRNPRASPHCAPFSLDTSAKVSPVQWPRQQQQQCQRKTPRRCHPLPLRSPDTDNAALTIRNASKPAHSEPRQSPRKPA